MSTREPRSVVSVAPGVVFVEGPVSNWVVLAEEDGVALIDAGYPADADLVLDTVRYAGHDVADLRRVYVTHGHVDHVGGIPGILRQHPHVEVLAHADELDNVRGPHRQQVTPAEIGGRLATPRVLRWLARAVRSDALRPVLVPTAQAFTGASFAGRAITPFPAVGHTAGSTAYLLPAAGRSSPGTRSSPTTTRNPRRGRAAAADDHAVLHGGPADGGRVGAGVADPGDRAAGARPADTGSVRCHGVGRTGVYAAGSPQVVEHMAHGAKAGARGASSDRGDRRLASAALRPR